MCSDKAPVTPDWRPPKTSTTTCDSTKISSRGWSPPTDCRLVVTFLFAVTPKTGLRLVVDNLTKDRQQSCTFFENYRMTVARLSYDHPRVCKIDADLLRLSYDCHMTPVRLSTTGFVRQVFVDRTIDCVQSYDRWYDCTRLKNIWHAIHADCHTTVVRQSYDCRASVVRWSPAVFTSRTTVLRRSYTVVRLS